jgi:hypothetical protein
MASSRKQKKIFALPPAGDGGRPTPRDFRSVDTTNVDAAVSTVTVDYDQLRSPGHVSYRRH